MAAGDASAGDVPGRFDVVIDGKGYVFLDSLEESIPFRTHRAVYGLTPPFVERQNVSNSYGDNAQDFFLTIRQRDWSLGEQQKFFRSTQDGRYWLGSNVDVSTPGQVSLAPAVKSLTFAAAALAITPFSPFNNAVKALTSTNMYDISSSGAIADHGAHGLGASPSQFGFITDPNGNVFFSTTAVGTVGVRKWASGVFSTFSATGCDALAFLNNTLYGVSTLTGSLVQYDTAGTVTTLFTWKDAGGTGVSGTQIKLRAFGGVLMMLREYGYRGGELWVYDGSGCKILEDFPPDFNVSDMEVVFGVLFISGAFQHLGEALPAVLFYDGSQVGILWRASAYSSTTGVTPPALSVYSDGLLFTDDSTASFMQYSPARGGVSSVGGYTVTTDRSLLAASRTFAVGIRGTTAGYMLPDPALKATSGYVISSLIDFDSSLKKVFRGITVEFNAGADGNGGSVDLAYQLESVSGAFTSLATGVTSGTEVTFPADTAGHSISVKVTLNKGTSTAGPTLRSCSVRGAPIMPQYPRGEYILDCTNTEDVTRQLRDGADHPLSGHDQVANLVAARNSTSPISVTDKVNGTFTAFVDVNDPEGFDVYEIHPATTNPAKAGSYVVRLTVRGV